MEITNKIAYKLADKYNINLDIVKFSEWKRGLKIELEHGSKVSILTNVSNDDLDITAKIAIVHLLEDPKYYYYLEKLEQYREQYWLSREKPSIFKNQ